MQKQSKLMAQLAKEQKVQYRSSFNEDLLDEIFSTICKIDPKNLMLVEFLSLIIERDFIKNSSKLSSFAELFQQFKKEDLAVDKSNQNGQESEQHKFGKRTFKRMLKELARRLYPGYQNAYENILYEKLTKIDFDEVRVKIDESVKKMLNKSVIDLISGYDNEMQSIFEIYMPENYNNNLDFKWEELKVLEKKLPLVCCLRFLNEAELVPQCISPNHFIDTVVKMRPPILPNSGNNKEAMFYTSETINSYLRDHAYQPQIKLLEGDAGLTFFEFQVLFMKLAIEFAKDPKSEITSNVTKLTNYLKIKEAFDDSKSKKTRFMEAASQYIKKNCNKSEKVMVRKRQSRKKIEDLYDSKDIQMEEESSRNIYRNMSIEKSDLDTIRKDLDNQLAELPVKRKVDKQNAGYFEVDKKHTVIGEQLPKIQQKSKASAAKDPKKKNEDPLLGYKPQIPKQAEDSDIGKIIQRPKKLRANNEFPIILNEVFYPSDLKSQLFISPQAEIYLETSYIHLGERLYEEAFSHYSKAKANTESKSPLTEFYYCLHAAQIFESAGRDEVSLTFYHKAKDLLAVLSSIEGAPRSHPYTGMGVCLYHLDEFQYALRCFEKARAVYGIGLEVESVDNAILQNNIGCCLMMLNRNQEGIKYFELSHRILDMKAGCFDERTLVVQQNFNKNRKAYLELLPEFRTMWKTYMQKSTTKLPAVNTGGAKKKK